MDLLSKILSLLVILSYNLFPSETLYYPWSTSPVLTSKDCANVLSESQKLEINKYKVTVELMLNKIKSSSFRNRTYNDILDFIYKIGTRTSGSIGEKLASKYLMESFRNIGLDNVHEESVIVPYQTPRKGEYAKILTPLERILPIIGFRWSIGTYLPIRSEAIVISSMAKLQENSNKIQGKIVVFSLQHPKSYVEDKVLMDEIMNTAVKYGALAFLSSSRTNFSLYTLHQDISPTYPAPSQIPCASLTIEDAAMLYRIYRKSGQKLIIELNVNNFPTTFTESCNVIGDYTGKNKPNEIVLISGHLDNVQLGLGVQDDAVGLFLSLNALRLMKQLNIRPQRTIQAALFSSEEMGFFGSNQFIKNYESKLKNGSYKALLEADYGCVGGTNGFVVSLPKAFQCVLHEILTVYFKSTHVQQDPKSLKTDINLISNKTGVPSAILDGNKDGKYFWYHHSLGDAISTIEVEGLNDCLGVYAVTAFILSNLDEIPM